MSAEAAKTSAHLSAFFLLVYGGSNWLAAQRSGVPAWYFEWERHIPFVPAMIVPYLSIDLLFVIAPFLCRDAVERGRLASRIRLAIAGAGLCFLAVPFRFGFDAPSAGGGPLAALFDGFRHFDRPFNLFPSLHVALCVILGETYVRRTRGATRMATTVWFVLIGASTVLTHQHHLVDVAGGLVLALAANGPIPGADEARRVSSWRLGARYALGAVVLALMAARGPWWSPLLFWPAASLSIVAVGYLGAGPRVLWKTRGRIAPGMRLIQAPYLLGQRCSLQFYRLQCRPWDAVVPGVWIGRALNDTEAKGATKLGVTAVLDLTAELSEAPTFRRLDYRNIQLLDLTAPSQRELYEAAQFIADRASRGVVYVHCKAGYSRSAAAVGAYLLTTRAARTVEDCCRLLHAARPSIVIRPEAIQALRQFAAGDCRPAEGPAKPVDGFVAIVLATIARAMCGLRVAWAQASPHHRPRIYFANHASHLDFLVLWASLPRTERRRTIPVAAREYWSGNRVRRYVTEHVFKAVLVERADPHRAEDHDRSVQAASSVKQIGQALASSYSLIVFPEGTRGSGRIGPFKSGLYHVCRLTPDIELVPAYLHNVDRILPKGSLLPVPLRASVTFGPPLCLEPGEQKEAFLGRARAALTELAACHASVS